MSTLLIPEASDVAAASASPGASAVPLIPARSPAPLRRRRRGPAGPVHRVLADSRGRSAATAPCARAARPLQLTRRGETVVLLAAALGATGALILGLAASVATAGLLALGSP